MGLLANVDVGSEFLSEFRVSTNIVTEAVG